MIFIKNLRFYEYIHPFARLSTPITHTFLFDPHLQEKVAALIAKIKPAGFDETTVSAAAFSGCDLHEIGTPFPSIHSETRFVLLPLPSAKQIPPMPPKKIPLRPDFFLLAH